MSDNSIAPGDATTNTRTQSPLSLTSLSRLLFAPKGYFSDPHWLKKSPEILFVAWISGIAFTLGRIDANIMKAELGASHSSGTALALWLNVSWLQFWAFVLGVGVIQGFIFWYLGGWWYRTRLDWSGAKNLDHDLVRHVYMYQDLVSSAPAVLLVFVQTWIFSSYREAWEAEELWSSTVIVFVFWSCVTSYKAASSAFHVSKWKARIWFFALPVLVYVVALGIIGAFYAQLDGSAA